MRGQPGSMVKLSVIRRGKSEPQEVDLVLAKLSAAENFEERFEGDIAYLRFRRFMRGRDEQIREKLAQLERKAGRS